MKLSLIPREDLIKELLSRINLDESDLKPSSKTYDFDEVGMKDFIVLADSYQQATEILAMAHICNLSGIIFRLRRENGDESETIKTINELTQTVAAILAATYPKRSKSTLGKLFSFFFYDLYK